MTTNTPKRAPRTRNYTAILYPESVPKNWKKLLQNTGIKTTVSPLHDQDTDEDGNAKKAHHHILFEFDSVKTVEQARYAFSDLLGLVHVEAVKNKQGLLRYLCHLDNPEKAQYDPQAVLCFNGASYEKITGNTKQDKYEILQQAVIFCDDNEITNYADLMMYCARHNFFWFKTLSAPSMRSTIVEILKTKDWQNRNPMPDINVNVNINK